MSYYVTARANLRPTGEDCVTGQENLPVLGDWFAYRLPSVLVGDSPVSGEGRKLVQGPLRSGGRQGEESRRSP
jgi:hypothetical protein